MKNKFRLEDIGRELIQEQKINKVYKFKNQGKLYQDRTFCPPNPECTCEHCTDCGCHDYCPCQIDW